MKYDYNFIKKYSLFDGLSESEIKKFIDLMKFETVKEKDVIMKEGDDGDTIVLLLSGEVSITQALTLKNKKAVSDNREKILIRLDKGVGILESIQVNLPIITTWFKVLLLNHFKSSVFFGQGILPNLLTPPLSSTAIIAFNMKISIFSKT